MFGFVNIYKPKGITSHDVVAKLRKITQIKQIGHTGTLDPFAQGVLPVGIGKATRLIEYLSDDKEYIATVQFGKNTDSYDIDGTVTEIFDKKVIQSDIIEALKDFQGEILQNPPIYSAIKVGGKKLYEYAREGKTIEIKPRKVNIYSINLNSFDEDLQIAEIVVSCSKGTYIRSIAYDLGKKLGCGAFLTNLVRTKVGKFEISSAKTIEEFKNLSEVINPVNVLEMPKVEITADEHDKVLFGQTFRKEICNGLIILIYNSSISAVALVEDNLVKVSKVFG